MKVGIGQKTLLKALQCGGAAALSEQAQSDTGPLSNLIKSVKITVDDNLIVESATTLMATRYSIPATKDNVIDVRDKGAIFVPAKELLSWVEKQVGATIGIIFTKFDTPEFIKVCSAKDDGSDNNKAKTTIKKIGTVKLLSRDESKTGNKWAVDCYDSEQIGFVDFSNKGTKLFDTTTDKLADGLKNVLFSAQKKHFEHIYDSVLVSGNKNELYIAASDTTRCSAYKLTDCKNVNGCFFNDNFRVLIPCEFLDSFAKLCKSSLTQSNSEIEIWHDNVKNKAFISQNPQNDIGWTFDCRVTLPDSQLVKKFPNIKNLLEKAYNPLCAVDKGTLNNRLGAISLVNKSMAIFKFSDNKLTIKAISEVGLSPSVSEASVTGLNAMAKAVLSVVHILDAVKTLKDSEITFNVPDNTRSFKITSLVDPNFNYFIMTNESSKYDLEKE